MKLHENVSFLKQLNITKNKFIITCLGGNEQCAKSTFRFWFLTSFWFQFTILENILPFKFTGPEKSGMPPSSFINTPTTFVGWLSLLSYSRHAAFDPSLSPPQLTLSLSASMGAMGNYGELLPWICELWARYLISSEIKCDRTSQIPLTQMFLKEKILSSCK